MITDLAYLRNMSGDNPDIIKEMIGIFIEQAEEYIRDMKKNLEDKNYDAIGKLAHKAKSSISIMGMNDLAADMKTLELLAKEEKEKENYPVFIDKFVSQTQLAITELKETASHL
jgi:HPt (histidine-containing phosphotransfer) domain-containing protein